MVDVEAVAVPETKLMNVFPKAVVLVKLIIPAVKAAVFELLFSDNRVFVVPVLVLVKLMYGPAVD